MYDCILILDLPELISFTATVGALTETTTMTFISILCSLIHLLDLPKLNTVTLEAAAFMGITSVSITGII